MGVLKLRIVQTGWGQGYWFSSTIIKEEKEGHLGGRE